LSGANFVLDKPYLWTPNNNSLQPGQFTAVQLTALDTVKMIDTLGNPPIGVCQELIQTTAFDATRVIDIRVIGQSKVVAGVNDVTVGAVLVSDTQGRAILASAQSAGQYPMLGIALSPSAAVGDWIDVLLTIGFYYTVA
jgi:hypothetical protein